MELTRTARRRGFTLVEVLVSLCILAGLLAALSILIFSMSELWGRGGAERAFARHTRAVTRHVEDMLHRAMRTASASGTGATALLPTKIDTPDGGGAVTLLSFTLANGDRLIPWTGEPLPDVACSLGVSSQSGLVLYWQSRIDLNYGKEPPQELVLSQFGKSIAYDYYDEVAKSWKTTDTIQLDTSNQPVTPGRVRLRFERGKQQIETVITLPVAVEGVPAT